MPIVKNDQNIKSFQIFKVKLVWPQLSNSPDLYGKFEGCGQTNHSRPEANVGYKSRTFMETIYIKSLKK